MREVLARGLPACHSLAEPKAGVLQRAGRDVRDPMTQTTARFELPGFRGTLRPGDNGYDDAPKIFNLRRRRDLSQWEDPAETEKNIAYTKDLSGAMKPWSTGRAYLNFLGDEGQARVEAAFV
jgi:hypothetical protein